MELKVSSWLLNQENYFKTWTIFIIFMISCAAYIALRKWSQLKTERKRSLDRPSEVVIIVGCDSGLGLSMAHWVASLGYKVVAGCLNPDGEGSKFLTTNHNGNDKLNVFKVDVRSEESIQFFRDQCERILNSGDGTIKLRGIIFNAAIMILGEYFWQTQSMAEALMDVNYWGALRVTTAFKKIIFQQKCRLIFTSSDCSLYSLPTLSTYCASKAALHSWARSLRLELGKYGVSVALHDPGSFPQQSQIMGQIPRYLKEMEAAFTEEDKLFYGDLISRLRDTKVRFNTAIPRKIEPMKNKRLEKSTKFLLEGNISNTVVHNSGGFELLQFVRDFFPVKIGDMLINKCIYLAAVWNPRQYGKLD